MNTVSDERLIILTRLLSCECVLEQMHVDGYKVDWVELAKLVTSVPVVYKPTI